jgi:hypothetical protein
MPKVPDWKPAEEIRRYSTESLFEYIDGAAEAYLGYDFRELAVGEYARAGAKTTVTAEIYDMGANLNAFGIYAAERYPESRFLSIGVQGYYEEGTLNFLAGRFYVKLLCFEGGEKAEEILTLFAGTIVSGIKDAGGFPARLSAFPAAGRIANSERFLRRGVLGLKFLDNGYRRLPVGAGVRGLSDRLPSSPRPPMKALTGYFSGAGKTVTRGRVSGRDPYLKNVYAAVGRPLPVTKSRRPDARPENFLAAS